MAFRKMQRGSGQGVDASQGSSTVQVSFFKRLRGRCGLNTVGNPQMGNAQCGRWLLGVNDNASYTFAQRAIALPEE